MHPLDGRYMYEYHQIFLSVRDWLNCLHSYMYLACKPALYRKVQTHNPVNVVIPDNNQ